MADGLVGLLCVLGTLSFLALSAWLLLQLGLVSLGQHAVFALGAAAALAALALPQLPPAAALALAALAGAAGQTILMLPALRLGRLHFAVASLVFAEAVRLALALGQPPGAAAAAAAGYGGIALPAADGPAPVYHLGLTIGLLALAVALFGLIAHAGIWRRLRMLGEDEMLAALQGVRGTAMRLCVGGAAGLLAGLGGGLYALLMGPAAAGPFPLSLGLHALACGLVGGLGSVFGPILAVAVDFGLIGAGGPPPAAAQLLFASLVALVLIWFPRGLLGGMRWPHGRRRAAPDRSHADPHRHRQALRRT